MPFYVKNNPIKRAIFGAGGYKRQKGGECVPDESTTSTTPSSFPKTKWEHTQLTQRNQDNTVFHIAGGDADQQQQYNHHRQDCNDAPLSSLSVLSTTQEPIDDIVIRTSHPVHSFSHHEFELENQISRMILKEEVLSSRTIIHNNNHYNNSNNNNNNDDNNQLRNHNHNLNHNNQHQHHQHKSPRSSKDKYHFLEEPFRRTTIPYSNNQAVYNPNNAREASSPVHSSRQGGFGGRAKVMPAAHKGITAGDDFDELASQRRQHLLIGGESNDNHHQHQQQHPAYYDSDFIPKVNRTVSPLAAFKLDPPGLGRELHPLDPPGSSTTTTTMRMRNHNDFLPSPASRQSKPIENSATFFADTIRGSTFSSLSPSSASLKQQQQQQHQPSLHNNNNSNFKKEISPRILPACNKDVPAAMTRRASSKQSTHSSGHTRRNSFSTNKSTTDPNGIAATYVVDTNGLTSVEPNAPSPNYNRNGASTPTATKLIPTFGTGHKTSNDASPARESQHQSPSLGSSCITNDCESIRPMRRQSHPNSSSSPTTIKHQFNHQGQAVAATSISHVGRRDDQTDTLLGAFQSEETFATRQPQTSKSPIQPEGRFSLEFMRNGSKGERTVTPVAQTQFESATTTENSSGARSNSSKMQIITSHDFRNLMHKWNKQAAEPTPVSTMMDDSLERTQVARLEPEPTSTGSIGVNAIPGRMHVATKARCYSDDFDTFVEQRSPSSLSKRNTVPAESMKLSQTTLPSPLFSDEGHIVDTVELIASIEPAKGADDRGRAKGRAMTRVLRSRAPLLESRRVLNTDDPSRCTYWVTDVNGLCEHLEIDVENARPKNHAFPSEAVDKDSRVQLFSRMWSELSLGSNKKRSESTTRKSSSSSRGSPNNTRRRSTSRRRKLKPSMSFRSGSTRSRLPRSFSFNSAR